VVQVDPEAGGELARPHPGGLALQHGAAREPAAEHLRGGLGVDAVGLQEHQGLGEQLDVAGHDQLVGRLHRLAGAGGADVHDGAAHDVEVRPRRLDVLGGPTDHDRERALLRAGLAAAHGRVDHADAALVPRLRDGAGHVGADRGAVDVQGAGLRGGVDAVVAPSPMSQRDVLDVRAVRHHRDHDLGVAHGVGHAARGPPAPLHESVHGGAGTVVAHHVVAGVDQVAGHGGTHDAEADEGDRGHFSSFRSQSKAWSLPVDGTYSSPMKPV
jgi:hypothetical protein